MNQGARRCQSHLFYSPKPRRESGHRRLYFPRCRADYSRGGNGSLHFAKNGDTRCRFIPREITTASRRTFERSNLREAITRRSRVFLVTFTPHSRMRRGKLGENVISASRAHSVLSIKHAPVPLLFSGVSPAVAPGAGNVPARHVETMPDKNTARAYT